VRLIDECFPHRSDVITTVTTEAFVHTNEQDRSSSFSAAAGRVADDFLAALKSGNSVTAILEAQSDSIYVKSSEGLVIYSNAACEELFSASMSCQGRLASAFLNDTVIAVSKHSDALVLAGCQTAEYDHPGCDARGRHVLFRTYKKSLLGSGLPQLAIFGMTRVIEITDDRPTRKIHDLSRAWFALKELEERDREIAMLIARGDKLKDIATKMGTSHKTIENRRNAMISRLGLESTLDLVKLMVRLQDNGFADFGL